MLPLQRCLQSSARAAYRGRQAALPTARRLLQAPPQRAPDSAAVEGLPLAAQVQAYLAYLKAAGCVAV